MRRKLKGSEIALLIILAVIILVSAYYLGFYSPRRDALDVMKGQIEDARAKIEVDQARVDKMKDMERELEQLLEENPDPVSMAPYDNTQNIMMELHTILDDTIDYSLNFTSVDTEQEDGIARRHLSIQFQADSYASAKKILKKLHDSENRCIFEDLSISAAERGSAVSWWDTVMGNEAEAGDTDEAVTVSATMVFFEYLPQDRQAEEQDEKND